jgi:hypothetical protein
LQFSGKFAGRAPDQTGMRRSSAASGAALKSLKARVFSVDGRKKKAPAEGIGTGLVSDIATRVARRC